VSVGRKAIREREWGRHTDILWLSFLVFGNAKEMKNKFCMLGMQHAQHKKEIRIKYLLQNTVGKFKLKV
jgi:hypothetical protein